MPLKQTKENHSISLATIASIYFNVLHITETMNAASDPVLFV